MCTATRSLFARAPAAVVHPLSTKVTVGTCSVSGICGDLRSRMHGIPAQLSPFGWGGPGISDSRAGSPAVPMPSCLSSWHLERIAL